MKQGLGSVFEGSSNINSDYSLSGRYGAPPVPPQGMGPSNYGNLYNPYSTGQFPPPGSRYPGHAYDMPQPKVDPPHPPMDNNRQYQQQHVPPQQARWGLARQSIPPATPSGMQQQPRDGRMMLPPDKQQHGSHPQEQQQGQQRGQYPATGQARPGQGQQQGSDQRPRDPRQPDPWDHPGLSGEGF